MLEIGETPLPPKPKSVRGRRQKPEATNKRLKGRLDYWMAKSKRVTGERDRLSAENRALVDQVKRLQGLKRVDKDLKPIEVNFEGVEEGLQSIQQEIVKEMGARVLGGNAKRLSTDEMSKLLRNCRDGLATINAAKAMRREEDSVPFEVDESLKEIM